MDQVAHPEAVCQSADSSKQDRAASRKSKQMDLSRAELSIGLPSGVEGKTKMMYQIINSDGMRWV